MEALAKHNSRNPESAVLYMNFAAQDPALTNDKCNFWHFRFDAHVDMKLAAITDYVARQKELHKIYLLNQDYAFGQAISAAAKDMLGKKENPDIAIVGDDLHPLGKVKDFSPYVAKIRASGAEAVITGNWGSDLSLLIKASKESGLTVTYYTLNAHNAGIPGSIGAAGEDHIKQVLTWHANVADNRLKGCQRLQDAFQGRFLLQHGKTELEMLARAINEAKSTDPLKVARALEGMKYMSDTGEVLMRPDDHQLMQPIYIATFTKLGKGVKYDVENTGYGWKTDVRTEARDTVMSTSCKMERP